MSLAVCNVRKWYLAGGKMPKAAMTCRTRRARGNKTHTQCGAVSVTKNAAYAAGR
jgi:hypothetical protein